MLEWAIDGVIGLGLVWLAWKALSGEDLYRSVILFISFGLVLALAWVRLEAPDIALAEAAIGAGLTGALLLDAVAQLGGRDRAGVPPVAQHAKDLEPRPARPEPPRESVVGQLGGTLPVVGVLTLGGAVALALAALSPEPGGLTRPVAEAIGRSGVDHGVTAVLLNFRAFDTLLEIGVLLAAVLAMLIVQRMPDVGRVSPPVLDDAVTSTAITAVIPLMVLTTGFLLWLGTHAPGGAFQAGAVLASAAVLLFLAGHRSLTGLGPVPLSLLLVGGFTVFVLVALGTLLGGNRLLELPSRWAGTLIVAVEAALTVSIAATLAALFIGARGPAAPAGGRTSDLEAGGRE